MVNLHPLLFLFLLQFLLVFIGLTFFLFSKYRQLRLHRRIEQEKAISHKEKAGSDNKEKSDHSDWKNMFDELQIKFTNVRETNAKLKESLAQLIPEAQRSDEYKQMIAEIEQNNRELDACIGTLQKENEQLGQESKSYKNDIDKLSRTLDQSVGKEEYTNLKAQKKRLELKCNNLTNDLEEKTTQFQDLEKKFAWLEKEYNALYSNVNEETV